MLHRYKLSATLALLASLAASPAKAHAILLESMPPLRATVAPGPTAVELRFNSRIDAARSRLVLIRADRSETVLPIAPNGPPDRLATQAELVPGDYTIRWQVLAVDGHITRGDVPFTVRAPTP